jgi:hypothetical protein
MGFAKTVFTCAGIWGLLVLSPLYLTFDLIGRVDPPPITHADFYYGFVAVALTWQMAFLIIGRDPVRFRPMMIAAIAEKFLYVSTLTALWIQGRLNTGEFSLAVPDFAIGILFVVAYSRVRSAFEDVGEIQERPGSSRSVSGRRAEGRA